MSRYRRAFFILLIMIAVPLAGQAHYGWGFTNYSLFYGGGYSPAYGTSHSFELLYDKAFKSCLKRIRYRGLGVHGNKSGDVFELGIKGMISPTLRPLSLSRASRIYHYVFAEGNKLLFASEAVDARGNNFRTGVGFMFNLTERKVLDVKVMMQAGYTFGQGYTGTRNALMLEMKVGIGFNPYRIKKSEEPEPPIIDP
jgi:hypothetical protein